MRASADDQIIKFVFPGIVFLGIHTFALLSVCAILSIIITALVLHFAVTVCWASRSAAFIVVTVPVVSAAVVLARGVVAASGRWRSSTSAWRGAITTASVRARFGWTIAAGVETPGG